MKRTSGFTLIELLIVIAIIGMLAALIAAGISGVQKAAAEAQARTDIETIQTGLKAYESDTGTYPGWNVDPDPDTNSFPDVFERLCGEKPPEGRGGRNAPYAELKIDKLVVEDPDEPSGWRTATKDERYEPDVEKFYMDPWENPYVYREWNSKEAREDYMINRDSFDLYSIGPNEIDQSKYGDVGEEWEPDEGEEGEEYDDIGNW